MKSILHYLYRFLSEGTLPVLIFLPFYLLVRVGILTWRRNRFPEGRPDPVRETVMAFFCVYLMMLFTQTFLTNPGPNEVRLVPFEVIIEEWQKSGESDSDRQLFIFNILGNIAVFVPIGTLAAFLFRRGFCHTAGVGFCLSLLIETVQIPLDRTTDVDDLILNTLGTVVGYGCYRVGSFLLNKKTAAKAAAK